MELISVIIPVYNSEKHLKNCIESVLNQTYPNLEIILVNDGSTDSSQRIIDELALNHSEIRTVAQMNSGVSAARNKGLEISKGDFIGFVDSDDTVHPEMYRKLYDNLKKHDAGISHCGYEMETSEGKKKFYGTGELKVQNREEALISLLNDHLFEPSVCNKLFKKEILKNIKFDTQIRFNEDLLFNVEAFINTRKSVYHDLTLYTYTYNMKSATRSENKPKGSEDVMAAASKIKQKLKEILKDENINNFYVRKLIVIYQSLYKQPKSEFRSKIKSELKNSADLGLSKRDIFIKKTIVDFPRVYSFVKFLYDKGPGRNKKWSVE